MNLENLVLNYIASAEQVFKQMKIAETPTSVDARKIKEVIEFAKAYLEDAKYYRDKNKFEVSLASVAYCEGLLDALRLLGAVNFEWSKRKTMKEK